MMIFWKSWGGGHDVGGTTTTTTIIITTIISPPPGVRNFGFSICALCLLRDVEKETHKHKVCCGKNILVYLKSGSGGRNRKRLHFPYLNFANYDDFLKIMGWGSWCGGTTIITIKIIFSPPPGVRNFGFSICALGLLRDVEKETHKHKVLWEKM